MEQSDAKKRHKRKNKKQGIRPFKVRSQAIGRGLVERFKVIAHERGLTVSEIVVTFMNECVNDNPRMRRFLDDISAKRVQSHLDSETYFSLKKLKEDAPRYDQLDHETLYRMIECGKVEGGNVGQ